MEPIRNEIAEDLPRCPRCGSKARRVEWRYKYTYRFHSKPEETPIHEARIECADNGGKCYHTSYFEFPDSLQYRGELPDIDYESQWKYIDAEWTRCALNYAKNKAYRDSLDKRRCSCGKVPRKGWSFCPHCGNPVNGSSEATSYHERYAR